MATNYEFKIEYSPGKFVKIHKHIATNTYTFYNLVDDVKKKCPGFAHLSPQTIRIRFLDEDGDYINLTEEDSANFEEMLQQAKFIEERSVKKVQLRISEMDSPLPCAAKQSPPDKKRKLNDDTNTKPVVGLQPRSIIFTSNTTKTSVTRERKVHDDNDSDADSMSDSDDGSSTVSDKRTSMTALDKYAHIAREKVHIARTNLEKQRQHRDELLLRLEAASSAAGEPNGKICGNCHLRLGHTVKKCTLEKCNDVFACGQERRHPGQFNRRRIDNDVARHEKILSEAENELQRRTSAIETVKKSKTKQIENNLLDGQKEDYMSKSGSLNWNLVRKHTLLIESYCKKHLSGRIPGKEAISDVLKKATKEYNENCVKAKTITRSKKRKGNPCKKTLEEHGVVFPIGAHSSSESEPELEGLDDLSQFKDTEPDLTRAIPKNLEEEENQLNLALHASLQTQSHHMAPGNYPHSSAINQVSIPMFPYDYAPARLTFNPYNPAPFVFPGYYNYMEQGLRYDQQEQFSEHQTAASTSTITRNSETASADVSDEIEHTASNMTACISNEALSSSECDEPTKNPLSASDESAALALLTLNKK